MILASQQNQNNFGYFGSLADTASAGFLETQIDIFIGNYVNNDEDGMFPDYQSIFNGYGSQVGVISKLGSSKFTTQDFVNVANYLVSRYPSYLTYQQWYNVLTSQLANFMSGALPPAVTNAQVLSYAVDDTLDNYNMNQYASQNTGITTLWNSLYSYTLWALPSLNSQYGTNLVLTPALFTSEMSKRNYYQLMTQAPPAPVPVPTPTPAVTNLQVLEWTVAAALQSSGISSSATQNTDLTPAQWGKVSGYAFVVAPQLNNQYGTNLVITQALIDNNLHMRKYWEGTTPVPTPTPAPVPTPTPAPTPTPVPTPTPTPMQEKDNKMLMMILFAGAFFLAIFPGQSQSVPEGETVNV